MNQDEWRAELLRIYDEAYERTHGKKPDDPTGGARVRRKPKAPADSGGAEAFAEVLGG